MRQAGEADRIERRTSVLLRYAAIGLGLGLVVAGGVARAQDDDDNDDRTFEEKIIGNILGGLGGKNMESPGIDYRERSPLVVPPKLDLPPPVDARQEVTDPNWPKDPDLQARKAARAARQESKPTPWEAARPLTPAELNKGRTAAVARASNDPVQPGTNQTVMMSPSQLGYTGGLFKLFHGNSEESAKFTEEPPRESLTQPPVGYQTPSSNYAYGTGPKKPLGQQGYDIRSGKELK